MIGKVSAGAWQRQQQPAHTDNFFQASSSSTPTQRRWCRAYLGGAPQRVILNGVGRARAGQWPVGAGVLAEELGVREVTRHSTAGELHSQDEQHCDRHRVAVRWAAPADSRSAAHFTAVLHNKLYCDACVVRTVYGLQQL